MKVAIMTDSSAGVTRKEALEHGIYVAQMPLTVGESEYLDGEGISLSSMMDQMRTGAHAKTSQPSIGQLMEDVSELLKTYDHVVFLPISSELSGTYQSASALVDDFEGKFTVIDTKFVSHPLWLQTKEVKALIDGGFEDMAALKGMLESDAYMFASIIPEDIQYLKRGGRISPAAAAIANLLKIVPVLKFESGAIDLNDKVRTFKKAVSKGVDTVLELHEDASQYDWIILHADGNQETIDMIKEKVEAHTNTSVPILNLEPIILAHTGPGTVVLAVRRRLNVLA